MDVSEIISDKSLKPKEKTEAIAGMLAKGKVKISDLLKFARDARETDKATFLEAMEHATKQEPNLCDAKCFSFAVECLSQEAPRVKWEAARLIGNVATVHAKNIKQSVEPLLLNAGHSGTVVRWSAAFALGEIAKLKLPLNRTLLPALEVLCEREEKESIRKIYRAALKKALKA